jgi:hypothetical protein
MSLVLGRIDRSHQRPLEGEYPERAREEDEQAIAAIAPVRQKHYPSDD